MRAQGEATNLRHLDNPRVDLDFVVERSATGETMFIDHKKMVDRNIFAAENGVDVSGRDDHEAVAFRLGKDSVKQKSRFLSLDDGIRCAEEVIHFFNLENISNKSEALIPVQASFNRMERMGCEEGLVFINYN